jgi:peptidoglycan/LPS O-acetylase OafA/YrhL
MGAPNTDLFPIRPKTIYSLQGTRGICALVVAIAHFDAIILTDLKIFLRPALAVDFFFVLSGFILYYRYESELKNGAISFLNYSLKRLARLVPLHIFTLFILISSYAIYTILLNYSSAGEFSLSGFPAIDDGRRYGQGELYSFVTDVFLLSGIGFHSVDATWNYPSWSVSSELFVGLAFGVIFTFRRAWLITISGLFILFCYIALWNYPGHLQSHSQSHFFFLDIGLLRTIGGFAAGVCVAMHRKHFERSGVLLSKFDLSIFSAIVLSYFILFGRDNYIDFIAIPAIAVLIGSLSARSGSVSKFLSSMPLKRLGDISFSVYLIHVTVIGLFQFVLTDGERPVTNYISPAQQLWLLSLYIPAVLVAATLCFKYIEKPSRGFLYNLIDKRSSTAAS